MAIGAKGNGVGNGVVSTFGEMLDMVAFEIRTFLLIYERSFFTTKVAPAICKPLNMLNDRLIS